MSQEANVTPASLEVKRYANRKLYVPEWKTYTNLRGLFDVVLHGRDVRVNCARTGRDVSVMVLGMVYQVMCVETGRVSTKTLMDRLRSDGAPVSNSL